MSKKPFAYNFQMFVYFSKFFLYYIRTSFFYLLPYKYIKKEIPIPQHMIATLHNTMRRIIIRRRYFEFTRKNKNFIQIMQNIDSLWNPFSFNYNQSKVFVLTRLCVKYLKTSRRRFYNKLCNPPRSSKVRI